VSVALRGNVSDFGIAEVFQLIGQQRKTGILELSNRGERVELVFDSGAVVSAAPVGSRSHEALGEMLVRCGLLPRARVDELHRECSASAQTLPRLAVESGLERRELDAIEDLLTRETIFRILRWQSGSFDFRAQPVEHARSVQHLLGAEQILMDGLRMVDEWQSFADLVPSEDVVFRRCGEHQAPPAGLGPAQEDEAIRRVQRLVDGRMTVRRIIDISLLGTFDATRALAELRRAGLIEPLGAADAQRLKRRAPAPAPRQRARPRGVIPALVSLGLLVAVAAAAQQRLAPPVLSGAPIEGDAFAALRQAYETRRLRHALDAFRFAEGRWPRDLGELEASGILPPPLATGAARPYYYSQRDGKALLLAPERPAR
jgi:hypothetical protein